MISCLLDSGDESIILSFVVHTDAKVSLPPLAHCMSLLPEQGHCEIPIENTDIRERESERGGLRRVISVSAPVFRSGISPLRGISYFWRLITGKSQCLIHMVSSTKSVPPDTDMTLDLFNNNPHCLCFIEELAGYCFLFGVNLMV